MKVPLADLRLGPKIRVERIDLDHVARLVEVGPAAWPPITVRAATMAVLDGAHRRAAAKRLDLDEIEATVVDVDEYEALAVAISSNIRHGLAVTLAERKRVAEQMVAGTDWSDARIANECGIKDTTVAALRPRPTSRNGKLDSRTGSDGRSRPASLPGAASGRERAAEVAQAEPEAPVRDIARKAGVSPTTAADVKRRVAAGEDPVPPRLRPVPPIEDDPEPAVAVRDVLILVPTDWSAHEACQASNATREFGRFMDRFTRWHGKAFGEWHLAEQCPAALRTEAADLARSMSAQWSRLADELSRTARLETAR